MNIPTHLPTHRFYYHYKHASGDVVNQYAYEVIGIGLHTEDDTWYVNYLPLYATAQVYQASRTLSRLCMDNRPLDMWMDQVVVKDGVLRGPRFVPIDDPAVIEELIRIKKELYTPIVDEL